MIFTKNNQTEDSDKALSDYDLPSDDIEDSVDVNEDPGALSPNLPQSKTPLRPSIISQGFEFIGELKAPDGNVTVDGVFRGTLQVKSLIVGHSGLVEGSIQAESLTLKGSINGTTVVGDLQVAANACLEGQTTYRDLTIARGAQVLGELKRS